MNAEFVIRNRFVICSNKKTPELTPRVFVFARLQRLCVSIAGRYLFLKCAALCLSRLLYYFLLHCIIFYFLCLPFAFFGWFVFLLNTKQLQLKLSSLSRVKVRDRLQQGSRGTVLKILQRELCLTIVIIIIQATKKQQILQTIPLLTKNRI